MVLGAVLESSTAEWIQILLFVFGGCCSNVWALEAVLKEYPASGTFLTFSQILYVAIQNLWGNVYIPARIKGSGDGPTADKPARRRGILDWVPRLKKRRVPLWRWGVQVVLFLGVSLLNNRAFAYKIPLTLHIIFRSGGLCVSMLTGWLFAGRRYSVGQAFAGIIITVGIVLATLSAPSRRTARPSSSTGGAATTSNSSADETLTFVFGVSMLSMALVLSALLGIWQEKIYGLYGKVWQEGLFYSHLLSLPFFAPLHGEISTTFAQYANTPSIPLLTIPTIGIVLLPGIDVNRSDPSVQKTGLRIGLPSALVALVMNVVTQGFCIRGVNRLTARVSSTTVNLVLTVRKAVSLGLSVWYYGSGITPGLALGGGMVLGGTILYGLAPRASEPKRNEDVSLPDVPHTTKGPAQLEQSGGDDKVHPQITRRRGGTTREET